MNEPLPELPPWRLRFEVLIRVLIFYSIFSFYAEVDFAKEDTSSGFWLWSERLVAIIFTIEYFLRWSWSKHGWKWPFTFYAIIDLLAILPFYTGFFLKPHHLGIIRSFRVLRLLKLTRYSMALDRFLDSFKRIRDELAIITVFLMIVIFLGATLLYEFEHPIQPDKITCLSDATWLCFITISTIGYGDIYPVTWPGRIIVMIVCILGLGVFGSFVSLLGSSLVNKKP